MAKYRIKFRKFGETKFVSHLDLVRLFTRLHTRAQLPLSYSEGFNPHPKMSIALPLSVGIESEGEYLEVSYDYEISETIIKDRLNEKCPIGIEIVGVKLLHEGERKLTDITAAEYIISVDSCNLTEEMIDAFLTRETIEIEKKTKRSLATVDIKELIFSLKLCATHPKGVVLSACLAAGATSNLKADLLMSALKLYVDGFSYDDYSVTRTAILDSRMQPFM